MDNPFVYGEVVPATAFVNRVVELDRLVGDLAAGQKVFLISPRRYGKSSLIRHARAGGRRWVRAVPAAVPVGGLRVRIRRVPSISARGRDHSAPRAADDGRGPRTG